MSNDSNRICTLTTTLTWNRGLNAATISDLDLFLFDVKSGTQVAARLYDDARRAYDAERLRTFRVGGEWQATEKLQVRAGVLRDHSGQKTDFYSPSLPDGDTWAFGLGGGWAFSKDLAANLGLFYAPFDKVTVTGTEAFLGSYTPSAFIASLGVVWRPL